MLISPRDLASRHFTATAAVQLELAKSEAPDRIAESAAAIARVVQGGGKILLCGNGGSAADAQHLAAEFTCRLRASMTRPGIPAIALTTDTSFLTACANDFGFESVFERLIESLGRSGDVLIVLSTSGNSPNVIRAVARARAQNILTIGFLGGLERPGGQLAGLVDIAIIVPSQTTAHIQESHAAIGHILCELSEEMLYGLYRLPDSAKIGS